MLVVVLFGTGVGDGAGVVLVVVVLSGTGVGDGAGVVVVVVVVLWSGTGVGFTVVVVVVLVSGARVVVVVLWSGATVVVFLSSIAAGVVDVGSVTTWSTPHARVAIIRQDTPTTIANLDGVIAAIIPRSDNFLLSLSCPPPPSPPSLALRNQNDDGRGVAGNRSIDCSRPKLASFFCSMPCCDGDGTEIQGGVDVSSTWSLQRVPGTRWDTRN